MMLEVVLQDAYLAWISTSCLRHVYVVYIHDSSHRVLWANVDA